MVAAMALAAGPEAVAGLKSAWHLSSSGLAVQAPGT